ncbi:MAG: glycosyltransferase [Hyphomonas sp.]
MRIAFFVNAFPIASEAFIASSAAALIEAGHEVDIFGLGNAQPSDQTSCVTEKAGLHERARNAAWPTTVMGGLRAMPGAIVASLAHHGLRRSPVFRPMTYRRTWLDFSAVHQALALPKSGNFDILHCQFATLAEYVLKHREAGLLSGKVVVNFRGYDISEVVTHYGNDVYDNLWSRADAFIANCDYFRQRAIGIGCPRERIDVIGSGIRLSDFPYREPRLTQGGAVRFVSIGRLIERKGLHHALAAIAVIKAGGRPVHYDLIGEGEDRHALETLSRNLGLSDEVTFHGAQPHEKIAPILSRANILLAPCMTSAVGGVDAPVNSIKEAMASGVLVAATRHGGIPELVEDGVTGALATENDAADLTRAVQRLLDLEAHWPDIAATARQKVTDLYEIDMVTGRLIELYKTVSAAHHSTERPPTPVFGA